MPGRPDTADIRSCRAGGPPLLNMESSGTQITAPDFSATCVSSLVVGSSSITVTERSLLVAFLPALPGPGTFWAPNRGQHSRAESSQGPPASFQVLALSSDEKLASGERRSCRLSCASLVTRPGLTAHAPKFNDDEKMTSSLGLVQPVQDGALTFSQFACALHLLQGPRVPSNCGLHKVCKASHAEASPGLAAAPAHSCPRHSRRSLLRWATGARPFAEQKGTLLAKCS